MRSRLEKADLGLITQASSFHVQVVSGLRKHVSLEEMQGRLVVVCTNLKPAKMREVMSYGMVRPPRHSRLTSVAKASDCPRNAPTSWTFLTSKRTSCCF